VIVPRTRPLTWKAVVMRALAVAVAGGRLPGAAQAHRGAGGLAAAVGLLLAFNGRVPATQAARFWGSAVLGLHAAPTGTLADNEQLGRARLAKPSMSPACPTPLKQRRLADARFLRSTSIPVSSLRAAASTLQGERSWTGWPAYGVHVISAVSFSVLPTIAHVSVRVALAAPNSVCWPAGIARTSPVGTPCRPGPR
jgi:hypothetical protein